MNDIRPARERADEAAADMYNGPISRQAFIRGYLTRDAEPNVQVEAVLRMCDALEQSIAKGNVAKESEHVLYWGVQDVRRAIEEATDDR